jgi:hypothetical protein
MGGADGPVGSSLGDGDNVIERPLRSPPDRLATNPTTDAGHEGRRLAPFPGATVRATGHGAMLPGEPTEGLDSRRE